MDMYWARVTATNDGGDGPPEELEKYITAMPRPGRRIQDTIWLITCGQHFEPLAPLH